MRRVLKSYEIKITTIGPVFIGNGKEINKKEYLFLNNKKIAVMNIEKLYTQIKAKRLTAEFERYILGKGKETLGQWMERHRISFKDIQNCVEYTLESGDLSIEKGKTLQIMQHIKDPYGNPYIPGSSVKGMLRTVLLGANILEHPEKYRIDRENLIQDLQGIYKTNRNALKRNISSIENKRYHILRRTDQSRDAVNDELSGFIVGDSDPLDVDCLVPCQKVEYHADGKEKRLNLLRECIKPGTEITLKLTIDESICKINAEALRQAIRTFNGQYYENFSKCFRVCDSLHENQVFLGGGCGFVSKTMIYPMFSKKEGIKVTQSIFGKTGVPRNHRHYEDVRLGVSPHILKCTRYKGELFQMGLCSLKIVPEK